MQVSDSRTISEPSIEIKNTNIVISRARLNLFQQVCHASIACKEPLELSASLPPYPLSPPACRASAIMRHRCATNWPGSAWIAGTGRRDSTANCARQMFLLHPRVTNAWRNIGVSRRQDAHVRAISFYVSLANIQYHGSNFWSVWTLDSEHDEIFPIKLYIIHYTIKALLRNIFSGFISSVLGVVQSSWTFLVNFTEKNDRVMVQVAINGHPSWGQYRSELQMNEPAGASLQ